MSAQEVPETHEGPQESQKDDRTVRSVHVSGFQSLHNVRMDLGDLTVVVGPSSSGKSALTRALRTLANNARGTGYVTQGMKRTSITATLGPDGRRVRLVRGTGENGYTLLGEGEQESQTFTKLAGEVPAEVRQYMAPLVLDEIHWAGQFDKPWLLDVSAQEAARRIGEVSRVGSVRAAAKEGNRRRLALGTRIRGRKEDLAKVEAQDEWVASVRERHERLTKAQEMADKALETYARSSALRDSLDTLVAGARDLRDARQALEAHRARLSALEGLSRAQEHVERSQDLRAALEALHDHAGLLRHGQAALEEARRVLGSLEGLSRARELSEKVQARRATLTTLRDAATQWKAAVEDLDARRSALKASTLERERCAADVAAHAPQTCPECGQALPQERR